MWYLSFYHITFSTPLGFQLHICQSIGNCTTVLDCYALFRSYFFLPSNSLFFYLLFFFSYSQFGKFLLTIFKFTDYFFTYVLSTDETNKGIHLVTTFFIFYRLEKLYIRRLYGIHI